MTKGNCGQQLIPLNERVCVCVCVCACVAKKEKDPHVPLERDKFRVHPWHNIFRHGLIYNKYEKTNDA